MNGTSFMTWIGGLLATALLATALPAASAPGTIVVHHQLINVERGIEAYSIDYQPQPGGRGQVSYKSCPKCDAKVVPASENVQLNYRDRPVPDKESRRYSGYSGTVFIKIKTGLVDRIRWDRDYRNKGNGSR
ncbi:MAG TPA: hypothetical protein VFA86_08440 [Gammaproteobacteria bacterium]|nr:hypothetical protein [Gammaproteobacteria bacterium]